MLLTDLLLIGLLAIAVVGWVTTIAVISIGAIGGMLDLRRWCRDALGDHRRRRGLCAGCGYDLRCSPRRCPECGLAAVARLTPHVISR